MIEVRLEALTDAINGLAEAVEQNNRLNNATSPNELFPELCPCCGRPRAAHTFPARHAPARGPESFVTVSFRRKGELRTLLVVPGVSYQYPWGDDWFVVYP